MTAFGTARNEVPSKGTLGSSAGSHHARASKRHRIANLAKFKATSSSQWHGVSPVEFTNEHPSCERLRGARFQKSSYETPLAFRWKQVSSSPSPLACRVEHSNIAGASASRDGLARRDEHKRESQKAEEALNKFRRCRTSFLSLCMPATLS